MTATMIVDVAPIAVVAAFVAGSAAQKKLSVSAQPLRLELAKQGECLAANAALPERVRRNVNFMLDHAFNMSGTLLIGIIFLPLICVVLFANGQIIKSAVRDMQELDEKLRNDLHDFIDLHDRITLINHPLLKPLFDIIVGACVYVGIFLYGLIEGRVPKAINRGLVASYVERRRPFAFRELKHGFAS